MPAAAHTTSQSFSQWDVQGALVDARLHLSAADFQEVAAADRNGDGQASVEELAAAEPLILLHARQTVRVWQLGDGGNGTPCPGTALGVDFAAGEGVPPRFPLTLRFTCPRPVEEVRLGFNLFAGTGLRFSHVARVRMPAGERHVVFTVDHRDQTLLANPSAGTVIRTYGALGVEHILWGADHLLFLLVLLLAAPRVRQWVVLVTSFTLAHSVTLVAAALGHVQVPARVVEPLIAASIVWVAVENAWLARTGASPRVPRAGLTFLFGLVHGLGFASALAETGLPQNALVLALGAFNAGVEMGQLLACSAAALGLWLLGKSRHHAHIRTLLSGGAAALGAYWTVSRLWGG